MKDTPTLREKTIELCDRVKGTLPVKEIEQGPQTRAPQQPPLMIGAYPAVYPVGRSLYSLCGRCRRIVKINKFVFGSLHICD